MMDTETTEPTTTPRAHRTRYRAPKPATITIVIGIFVGAAWLFDGAGAATPKPTPPITDVHDPEPADTNTYLAVIGEASPNTGHIELLQLGLATCDAITARGSVTALINARKEQSALGNDGMAPLLAASVEYLCPEWTASLEESRANGLLTHRDGAP